MADKFDLIADIREESGKGASRRLRHTGKVPAIIYGAGRPPRALTFDQNKVLHQLENESFYSSILNIKVGEKSQAAIVKDIQRHPARNIVLHMDFQRIVDDEKIKMNVPIHFLGEEVAIGVKDGGGKVSRLRTDVEVTCLPKEVLIMSARRPSPISCGPLIAQSQTLRSLLMMSPKAAVVNWP